jgi:hypothetical protein
MSSFHGVEFHHRTGNYNICGEAVFTVLDKTTYRLSIELSGWTIQKKVNGEWETINSSAKTADVVDLLPKDIPFQWDWKTFLVALTFYGYGDVDGGRRADAEWEAHSVAKLNHPKN